MFVNVVELPPVAEGRDAQFRAWFEWSTTVYAGFEGFVCASAAGGHQGAGPVRGDRGARE